MGLLFAESINQPTNQSNKQFSVAFSLQANYTDRAATTCRRRTYPLHLHGESNEQTKTLAIGSD
jgi:hypothetical protein